MRLPPFLRRLTQPTPPPDAPSQAALSGASLDVETLFHGAPCAGPADRLAVQAAVLHHLEWCVLFNEHLSLGEHPSRQLPALPSAANSELGIWLEALRSRHAPEILPDVEALATEHAYFHELARQALALAHQGRLDLASTLLNTDFERSRARVLKLLRAMQSP